MNKLVLRFVRDQSGATAIEYGLIVAGHRGCDYRYCAGARDKFELHVQHRFHLALK